MTSTSLTLDIVGEGEQLALGARLARAIAGRAGVIYLRGELGSGKTTLVRGLLRALGHTGAVRSPTYTLIEPYDGVEPPVVHLDLYRLSDPEELDYLGLRDLLGRAALLLIEWPERGAGALPRPDLEVRLEHAGAARRAVLQVRPAWSAVLAALAAAGPSGDR